MRSTHFLYHTLYARSIVSVHKIHGHIKFIHINTYFVFGLFLASLETKMTLIKSGVYFGSEWKSSDSNLSLDLNGWFIFGIVIFNQHRALWVIKNTHNNNI